MEYELPPSKPVLGAAVSLEFECSIDAANAADQTRKLFDEKHNMRANTWTTPQKVIGLINGTTDRVPITAETIHLDGVSLDACQPVRLALIEPSTTVSKDIVERKWFRSVISTKSEKKVGDPQLVALFGNTALTLATFAHREDGACSYIQIGQETDGDSLFIVASDEETGRHDIVKAIRALVCKEALTQEQQAALQALLDTEIERNRDYLMRAFEAHLADAYATQSEQPAYGRLQVLESDGSSHEHQYDIKQVLGRTLLANKRLVTLLVGRPIDTSEATMSQLFAVTRGAMGVRLASLDSLTGQLTFESQILQTDMDKRREAVFMLLTVLRKEALATHEPINFPDDTHASSSPQALGSKTETPNVDAVVATYLRNYTSLSRFLLEGDHLPNNLVDFDRDKFQAERLLSFLNDPTIVQNPYPESKVLKALLDRWEKENDTRATLLGLLGVNDRLDSLTSAPDSDEERWAEIIHHAARRSVLHKGVIRGISTSKTTTDISLEVDIQRDGNTYEITTRGKPIAMREIEPRNIPPLSFKFDISHSIKEQLGINIDNLRELLHYLGQLEPLTAEHDGNRSWSG